jgi:hypothetical protein
MPNWCDNWVKLSHDDPAMVSRAAESFQRGRFLTEFVPVPPELDKTQATIPPSAEQLANKARYGYESWFDWCGEHWGTIKELFSAVATPCDDGHGLEVRLDSAWSPPRAAYETLEKRHGFRLTAYYFEPAMHICGMRDKGVLREIDIFNVKTLDEVKAIIPPEMDARLGVSTCEFLFPNEDDSDEDD